MEKWYKTSKMKEKNEKEVATTVKRSFLSAMWYYHKFFVKETPSFIGKHGRKWRVRKTRTTEIHEQYYPLTIGQKIRYPFVYIKFMLMCAKDWYYWRCSQNHA